MMHRRARGGACLPGSLGALLGCFLLVLAASTEAADSCLECHAATGLAAQGRELWIHEDIYETGPHGRLTCDDCHKGAEGFPHDRDMRVRCDLPCHVPGASHEAISTGEAQGVHFETSAPSCLACHGWSDPDRGADDRCVDCHGDLSAPRIRQLDSVGAFGAVAHGRAGERAAVPGCTSCHGNHGIRKGVAARESCRNEGCHAGTTEEFGLLFDHKGQADTPRWGGASRLFLAFGAVLGLVALLHTIRG